MKSPEFIPLQAVDAQMLAREATAGLQAVPARVAPKFFYDGLGSHLFDAITELDEYYPTRTESAIMAEHGPAIVGAALRHTGAQPVLVDLGAGSCAKAARLFAGLAPRRYVAVDISAEFLHSAMQSLQREHPMLDMVGVALDFSQRLALPPDVIDSPALLFYPGSSIGNFAPEDALRLLREAREASRQGALLIGADLVKPTALLEAAYDDGLGVTAAFNLNVLRHLNRLLGADFDVRAWRHVARFDDNASRIEMHLRARDALTVRWHGGERRFASGETIHTENSYKWQAEAFGDLLRKAGWRDVQCWTDAQRWFGVFVARA